MADNSEGFDHTQYLNGWPSHQYEGEQNALDYYFQIQDKHPDWRSLPRCSNCMHVIATYGKYSGRQGDHDGSMTLHMRSIHHTAMLFHIPHNRFRDLVEQVRPSRPHEPIGWKALTHERDHLVSLHNGMPWLPNETVFAKCDLCEEVPGEFHTCGLYFFWDIQSVVQYGNQYIYVQCEIGGKVIEHEYGCRAEAAVIRGILHNDCYSYVTQQMARLFDVPLLKRVEGWVPYREPWDR